MPATPERRWRARTDVVAPAADLDAVVAAVGLDIIVVEQTHGDDRVVPRARLETRAVAGVQAVAAEAELHFEPLDAEEIDAVAIRVVVPVAQHAEIAALLALITRKAAIK